MQPFVFRAKKLRIPLLGLWLLSATALPGRAQNPLAALPTGYDQVANWRNLQRAELASLLPGADQDRPIVGWHGWQQVRLSRNQQGQLCQAIFVPNRSLSVEEAKQITGEKLGADPAVTHDPQRAQSEPVRAEAVRSLGYEVAFLPAPTTSNDTEAKVGGVVFNFTHLATVGQATR